MKFESLPIGGAFNVIREPHDDERGSFARIWSAEAFVDHGLPSQVAETSLSHTSDRGTLRGIHYQVAPYEEAKLVTCLTGSVWDVMVDLRPASPTFLRWHGQVLAGDQGASVHIPEGVAHGLLTLTDDVLVLYQISAVHDQPSSRGVRWDDPSFAIAWPATPLLVSERDRSFPDYQGGTDRAEGASGRQESGE